MGEINSHSASARASNWLDGCQVCPALSLGLTNKKRLRRDVAAPCCYVRQLVAAVHGVGRVALETLLSPTISFGGDDAARRS